MYISINNSLQVFVFPNFYSIFRSLEVLFKKLDLTSCFGFGFSFFGLLRGRFVLVFLPFQHAIFLVSACFLIGRPFEML